MKLNINEIGFIKLVLGKKGEKVTNDKGDEVFAPRNLNNEESSQRNHFTQNSKEALETFTKKSTELDEKIKELIKPHNDMLAEMKKDLKKKKTNWEEAHESLVKALKDFAGKSVSAKTLNELPALVEEGRIDLILSKDEKILKSLEETKEKMKVLDEEKKAMLTEKYEVRVEDKTLALIKKYFKDFSDTAGFSEADDAIISELNTTLSL